MGRGLRDCPDAGRDRVLQRARDATRDVLRVVDRLGDLLGDRPAIVLGSSLGLVLLGHGARSAFRADRGRTRTRSGLCVALLDGRGETSPSRLWEPPSRVRGGVETLKKKTEKRAKND